MRQKRLTQKQADDFYRRQVSSKVDVELKNDRLRQEREADELKQCVFQPNLAASYNSTLKNLDLKNGYLTKNDIMGRGLIKLSEGHMIANTCGNMFIKKENFIYS